MLAKTAYELIKIVPNFDYINNAKVNDGPIFRLHCIKTNEGEVKIQSYKGDMITFPKHSFICGAVYDIIIRQMIFDERESGFVGYLLKDKPINMRD
jgi:hypothetical protein